MGSVIWLSCIGFGASFGAARDRAVLGILLGAVLGPVGLLVIIATPARTAPASPFFRGF